MVTLYTHASIRELSRWEKTISIIIRIIIMENKFNESEVFEFSFNLSTYIRVEIRKLTLFLL